MEKKYVVYTISLKGQVMYVGISDNFERRKLRHIKYRGNKIQSAIPIDIDLSLIEITPIKEYKYHKSALKEEDKLIIEYNTIEDGWNKNRSGLIYSDRIEEYNKEYDKKWHNKWRIENREKYNLYMKEYRNKHKDEINAKRRKAGK